MTTIQNPRALIFDWDNTLVDSWDAIEKSINHVRSAFGQPIWSPAEIRKYCTRAARESFPEWFGDDWQKAYDVYYAHFDKVRKESKISALTGAEELLLWLKEKSVPLFVVSNKHGNYLRQEAERLSWHTLFTAIVGAQDAARDKPAREPVDLALYKAGIKADADVWFVGDSEIDMICARNAGCTPIFIGSEDSVARRSAARSFTDCTALKAVLYNIFENS